ncbi:MAG: toll/interleukin-1 receptor domain-containing protein [Bacteroidetes bacterium]|nr:toll/interleukin-1 receptor domain-containing protein [Bacteroidota bacterium]
MTKKEIQKLLHRHKMWLADRNTGERLNLRGATLTDIDLSMTDLSGAFLNRTDLTGANLYGTNLYGVDLTESVLVETDLTGANLCASDFIGADLSNANLSAANLRQVNFFWATLDNANLTSANLYSTSFIKTFFNNTNLDSAILGQTVFSDVDLLQLEGLANCLHRSRSYVDANILLRYGDILPQEFLRGIGLTEDFIKYLPSLSDITTQYYSCFILYPNEDKLFAKKLHKDLQNEGVRCWLTPDNKKTGDRVKDLINEVNTADDKLLFILSNNSIDSKWIITEVEDVLAEDGQRKRSILMPLKINSDITSGDKSVLNKILSEKHISDFTNWNKPNEYNIAFNELLENLKVN